MVNYHPDKQTNQLNLKRLQISFAYFINYMMCKTLENKRKKQSHTTSQDISAEFIHTFQRAEG